MLEILDSVSSGGIIISRLTIVEITSALVRRSRQGQVNDEDLSTALRLLEEDIARSQIVEVDGATMQRAIGLARKYGLRASDNIQLASALLARAEKRADGDFTLVSSDYELNAAAGREGLLIVDPTVPE